MIKPDFSPVKDLFLTYPKGFAKPYGNLTEFYQNLIKAIPDDIQLYIIVNNEKAEKEIKSLFPNKKIKTVLIKYFEEIWLRDIFGFNTGINRIYRPIFKPDYCSYIYTGSYLKQIENQVKQIFSETIRAEVVEIPLVLDGGNMVTNGEIGFITDKIKRDNPEVKNYIEKILYDYLGIKAVIIEGSKSDILGHSDGYLSFLSKNKICVSSYPEIGFLKDDIENLKGIEREVKNQGIEVIKIHDRPIDEKVIGGGKEENDKSNNCLMSARGIYVNHLILNDTIILPEYSIPNYKKTMDYNKVNKKILEEQGFKVITVNCNDVAILGGSLHCISFTN